MEGSSAQSLAMARVVRPYTSFSAVNQIEYMVRYRTKTPKRIGLWRLPKRSGKDGRMGHFYFNIRDGDSFEEDTEGVDLPSSDFAKREAVQAAREMMIEEIASGLPVSDQVFEVWDNFGVLLFELKFKDLLHS